MVRPESAAVTPLSTSKTRLFPPASMVRPAAGPVIVSSPPVSLSSSWPAVRVIVWCGREDGRVEGDRLRSRPGRRPG